MKRISHLAFALSVLVLPSAVNAADPLPGTKPLEEKGDLARLMVDGIHKYLDRELAASPAKRDQLWKPDTSSVENYQISVEPHRARLRKVLGVVDPRLLPRMEYVGGPDEPAVVADADRFTVYAVRWPVLAGVDGEGLLLEPKGKVHANVVAVPDADQTPEQVVGLAAGVPQASQFARRLAENGCRVIVPVLIDRADTFSGSPKLNRWTNQPHREFVHRMAYEMGRTLIGYEVQKVLAVVDWFCRDRDHPPVGVIGHREGGLIAFHAALLDPRIKAVHVSEYFGPQEELYRQPIYRNVWGYLSEFGNDYAALLLNGRRLLLDPSSGSTISPPPARSGRSGAAPSDLLEPRWTKKTPGGWQVYNRVAERLDPTNGIETIAVLGHAPDRWLQGERLMSFIPTLVFPTGVLNHEIPGVDFRRELPPAKDLRKSFDPAARQKRQFDQLVAFTQKLWRDSDAVRKDFWKKADASSPEKWQQSCEWYRDYFHTEVIGKLPEPTIALNPRSRQVYDEPTWTGYEVMLDVYPDVFASGILLLPKDLKPGEKRPVVVCQHGLEGRPVDTIKVEPRPVYNHFSKRLVELGYIVYAPQNPYIGQTHFRQIQRKAQPLKLALFSFIVRQHQRTLDWLETLPNVDPKRIAFYGLSYGGKTAMRVPAIEKRYCLSICSADFNEWIGKNVSVDLDRSYMWTVEYDMYEFDLGNTFNYAEMAYLIAPRPFMVERGHDDGVGTDEMVAYEYAKVRYLYANRLKIPDRTAIEFSAGGHEIFLKGTLEFLEKHIGKPK